MPKIDLKSFMLERMYEHLDSKMIASCSEYTCRYRVMGKPFAGNWSFRHHPWLREMHDCTSERVIGQKAAQMGFSEWALNKAFYAIEIEHENVLYVLPTSKPDASDFSTSRFDPALEMSPHLSKLFTDVQNTEHKRAGTCNLFIRGSRSRNQLKSIPAARVILDEVDEMCQENISLAFERMSGQLVKQAILLSTPTRANHGINAFFQNSTQDHFTFVCPYCNRWTELLFPDCLVILGESLHDKKLLDSHIICHECKHILPHDDKIVFLQDGQWHSTVAGNLYRGFYINQLYSMTTKPYEIAISAIRAQTNLADEQEYWNQKGGLPHTVSGAQVLPKQIEACRGSYIKGQQVGPDNLITLGVDVGKVIHYEIDQWILDWSTPAIDINVNAFCKVLDEGHVTTFEELDLLMYKYFVKFCVVDREPETRAALSFALRFMGRVALCKYTNGPSGRILDYTKETHSVAVNRTAWLDMSLGRFHKGEKRIKVPMNLSLEYVDQVGVPIRKYERDANQNPVGTYDTPSGAADHAAHARNYAEIALPLAVCLLRNEDIREAYHE